MNRLILIGGFLGAGKTTVLLKLAKVLLSKGMRIGLVTNDQGSQLVDTEYLAAQGLPVYDVQGGCFCCHFNELIDRLNEMHDTYWPDVILAEPVGSCTDLVATIFKPMQAHFARQFQLSPLSVVIDPLRLSRFIEHKASGSLTDMDYLFVKQLEEADVHFLNKCDTLPEDKVKSLLAWLAVNYPDAEQMPGSALRGEGIEALAAMLQGEFHIKPSLSIDYGMYGDAEAALGWCNATFGLTGTVDPRAFTKDFFQGVRQGVPKGADLAHLKALITGPGGHAKVSLTHAEGDIGGLDTLDIGSTNIHVIVNARITMEPAVLLALIETSAKNAAAAQSAGIADFKGDSFSPAPPNPPYRYE